MKRWRWWKWWWRCGCCNAVFYYQLTFCKPVCQLSDTACLSSSWFCPSSYHVVQCTYASIPLPFCLVVLAVCMTTSRFFMTVYHENLPACLPASLPHGPACLPACLPTLCWVGEPPAYFWIINVNYIHVLNEYIRVWCIHIYNITNTFRPTVG